MVSGHTVLVHLTHGLPVLLLQLFQLPFSGFNILLRVSGPQGSLCLSLDLIDLLVSDPFLLSEHPYIVVNSLNFILNVHQLGPLVGLNLSQLLCKALNLLLEL